MKTMNAAICINVLILLGSMLAISGDEFHADFPFTCGGKYFRVTTRRLTYGAAAVECADLGGRLLVIKNKEISNCVEKAIRAVQLPSYHFWIGMTRIGEGALEFAWSDGSLLRSGDFSNWRTGEPYNVNGIEYCVALTGRLGLDLRWNDFKCTDKRFALGYICESR